MLEPVRVETGIDPSTIEQDGAAIVLGLMGDSHPLPLDSQGLTGHSGHPLALAMQLPGSGLAHAAPEMAWETMQQLSKAYFDNFNFLYPIVDRQSFQSNIMPTVFSNGFDEGMASTVALLVFALGEVVAAGSQGPPIHVYNGRPSGIRGGSATRPPGLALFNEARRRMGFNLTECSIENVQIFALAGYVSVNLRHLYPGSNLGR
jgi:hypothetical protein